MPLAHPTPPPPMLNSRALLLATILGTILQIAMVVAGHSNPSVAKLFAVGGMGFSLLAGLAYVWLGRGARPSSPVLGGWLGSLLFGAARATA